MIDINNVTLKEAAIEYAKQGWAVFPLLQNDKIPIETGGFHNATTDLVTIEKWWTKNPNYNIGIATGSRSGFFVIDLDDNTKKENAKVKLDGKAVFKKWCEDNYITPRATIVSKTGGGGTHLLFKLPNDTEIRNKTGLMSCIDIRGDGGYIVAPPSIHKSGTKYQWATSWTKENINEPNKEFIDFALGKFGKHERAEAYKAPQSEIYEGSRTETLFKLVSSLVFKGLSDEAIKAAVKEENEIKCSPPLTDQELEREVFPAIDRYRNSPKVEYNNSTKSFSSKKVFSLDLSVLSETEEKEAEWLITDYIPKKQITLLAGDGGSGKTTIWCAIAAAISSGKPSFFDIHIPKEFIQTEGQKVLFFSAEDDVSCTLIKRLKTSGAKLENLNYIGIEDERFKELNFNSEFLANIIEEYKPALCIFDPIQAFIPDNVKMSERNAMRHCLNPLIALGKKYGTTFLIVVHTNKRSGAWGRNRLSDSSDIWDIARSVLIVGDTTEKSIRYVSHEKSNLGRQGETILFSIENGKLETKGTSDKKDKDYVRAADYSKRQAPQREEAKTEILTILENGDIETKDLTNNLKAMGYSTGTIQRAKSELSAEGKIEYKNEGFAGSKKFMCSLKDINKVIE